MNTPILQSSAPTPAPVVLALSLLVRLRAVACEYALSVANLMAWLRAHIRLQQRWAGDARAIDDPIERALVTLEHAMPTIRHALANDTRTIRSEVLRAIDTLVYAARETHRRTETHAAQLEPRCPAHLLAD